MGHKEEMGGNAVVRPAVLQDLRGQQEAQGCEGGCEVTAGRSLLSLELIGQQQEHCWERDREVTSFCSS